MIPVTRASGPAEPAPAGRLGVIVAGLGPYARPYRRHLRQALLASLVVVLAQLAFPWPLKALVELQLAETRRTPWLSALVPGAGSATWLVGAFVVIGLVFGVAELWQRLAVARFVVPTVNDARVGIFARLMEQTPGDSPIRDPGDVLTRTVTDAARLRVGLKGVLIHLLQHGLFVFGVCAVLLVVDLRLGLVYLGGLGLAIGVALGGAGRASAAAGTLRRRQARAARLSLRVAADGGQPGPAKDLDRQRSVAVVTQVKGLTAVLVQGLLALTACGVLMLSVHYADIGRLTPGDVALVASYLLMLNYPTMRLGRQVTRLGPQITSAERLARLADPGRTGGDRQ